MDVLVDVDVSVHVAVLVDVLVLVHVLVYVAGLFKIVFTTDGHPEGVQDGSQGWRVAPPLEYGIKS